MASSVQNNKISHSQYCTSCRACNMLCWRACKWIPVLLIVSIVTWSYYAYVIQLCIFTIRNTVQQCVYLIIFHILLFMFSWAYWRTIFAEIQSVPDKYKLPESQVQMLLSADSEEAQRSVLDNFAKDLPIVTRTMSGSVRYCNRCVLIKPDRAHHCSICARCVLKMDHHCPWVNNCVCYFNYKFFILFLGYALLYCLFIMATCLPYFYMFWKDAFHLSPRRLQLQFTSGPVVAWVRTWSNDYPSIRNQEAMATLILVLGGGKGSAVAVLWLRISKAAMTAYHQGMFGTAASSGRYHIVFAFFVSLMFAISLGSLFGYHLYLLTNNRTTLEAFRAPMFRAGADKNGFSIGCFNNFKEVFGNSPKLWLVPVFSSLGNGCDYPVRREHELRASFTAPQEPHGYESMGTTRSSFGDGIVYPVPRQDEDTESLLSSERWDRWGERARPFDDRESSSYDEL